MAKVNIKERYNHNNLSECASYLKSKSGGIEPLVGVICGSGCGGIVDTLSKKTVIPFSDIPWFPKSTVKGHAGSIVFGLISRQKLAAETGTAEKENTLLFKENSPEVEEVPIVCLNGRFHPYEGNDTWLSASPVYVFQILGCKYLVLTNSAGVLNTSLQVGQLTLIRDHLFLMGWSGNSPLYGKNDEKLGVRFPPMKDAYSLRLRRLAQQEALQNLVISSGRALSECVYAQTGGPQFETSAEMRALRILGADLVGMSTAHECIAARHCGMEVLGISLATNMCVPEDNYAINTINEHNGNSNGNADDADLSHEEVLATGKAVAGQLIALVTGIIRRIHSMHYAANGYHH